MNKYYTYAYLREDGTPYYVGKGKKRKYDNTYSRTLANHGRISVRPQDRIVILKHFELEFDAYKHEIYMIDVFGRKDIGTGILLNRTMGGGGASNPSQEVPDITPIILRLIKLKNFVFYNFNQLDFGIANFFYDKRIFFTFQLLIFGRNFTNLIKNKTS